MVRDIGPRQKTCLMVFQRATIYHSRAIAKPVPRLIFHLLSPTIESIIPLMERAIIPSVCAPAERVTGQVFPGKVVNSVETKDGLG